MLDRLREEAVASYQHFATPEELREALANDLAVLLTERFSATSKPPPAVRAAGQPSGQPLRPAPLPLRHDRFIDRTQEVAAAQDLLRRDDVGVVTLTGPGGVGKTRVALEVARASAGQFADGIAFLSLASLTDPQLLIPTIAQGLGIVRDERQPMGERLLERLRPKRSDAGRAALGLSRHGLAGMALAQGDLGTAVSQAEQSVALFRALGAGQKRWLAHALSQLGLAKIRQGEPAAARPALEESLALCTAENGAVDGTFATAVLFHLGQAAEAMDDFPAARGYYERSLGQYRGAGDSLQIAMLANAVQQVATTPGGKTESREMLADNLSQARDTRDRYDHALLTYVGAAALRQIDLTQAESLLTESLRLWLDVSAAVSTAHAVAGLAGVAAARGQAERAGRLYGAAQTLMASSGRHVGDAGGPETEQDIAAARTRLDPAAFAAGWAAGQAMTVEQATDYAREVAQQTPPL